VQRELQEGKAALAKSRLLMEGTIADMRDGIASRSVVIERLELKLQEANDALAAAHAEHAAEMQVRAQSGKLRVLCTCITCIMKEVCQWVVACLQDSARGLKAVLSPFNR
jgi:hypothetical protein